MNVVYKMINQTRLKNNTPPYYYIGSKTNCTFENGIIFDKFGKKYYSSTKSIVLKEHLKTDKFIFEILFVKAETDSVDINFYERKEQMNINKKNWDLEYYNKAYAISGFTTSGFANYHFGDGKIISLPINHPDVLSGKAIGQQKNRKASQEEKAKLKMRLHPSKKINWSEYLKGHKKNKTSGYHNKKSATHRKNIANSKKKRIEKLDKNLNHIAYYNSIGEASDSCEIKRGSISACCLGRTKTAHGYIFRYCKVLL